MRDRASAVSGPSVPVTTWRPIAAGCLALIVAMGIGRFTYTPILPSMEQVAELSPAVAGLLATTNYAGYLLRAIGATRWSPGAWRLQGAYGVLFLSAMTTGAMGYVSGTVEWAAMRGLSGVASGVAFVWMSSIVLDWVAYVNRSDWAGFVYAGVGMGIALTGIATPELLAWGGWTSAWRGLGAIALILGLAAWWSMPTLPTTVCQGRASQEARAVGEGIAPWRLLLAYGLEGCGYTVMGTFDVILLDHLPGLEWWGMWSWTLIGAAAVPSAWAWGQLARRHGARLSLVGAYGLQTAGILLPRARSDGGA